MLYVYGFKENKYTCKESKSDMSAMSLGLIVKELSQNLCHNKMVSKSCLCIQSSEMYTDTSIHVQN